MKRILLVCMLLFLCSLITKAQTQIGGFLAYSAGIQDFGLGVTGEYFVKDNISLVGNAIIYFPKTVNDYRKNWFEVNINSHYFFYNHDAFQFYGLGGFNYSVRHFKNKVDDTLTFSEGLVSFNLGTGINYKTSSGIMPFSEAKLIIGPRASVVISAGLKLNIGK